MKKDIIKSLIAIKQSEIPFDVIDRDVKLPLNRKKIITIPGVRRCGKSTLMEIAINSLIEEGVPRENILWLGFDDERLVNMSSDELNDVITAYMEMYPNTPIKEVHLFLDEIQLIEGWEYLRAPPIQVVLQKHLRMRKQCHNALNRTGFGPAGLSVRVRNLPIVVQRILPFQEHQHPIVHRAGANKGAHGIRCLLLQGKQLS